MLAFPQSHLIELQKHGLDKVQVFGTAFGMHGHVVAFVFSNIDLEDRLLFLFVFESDPYFTQSSNKISDCNRHYIQL
jgi:hypothetical protein